MAFRRVVCRTYAEILTDREYTRLLDKGATSEEIEEARQRKIERLRKRQEQSANKTHDDVAQKRLRLKLEGSDSDAASGTNNGRGRRTPRLALKRRLSGSPNSNGGLDADAEQDVATQPVSSSGRPVRKRMSFAVQKQPEKASTRKKRPTLYTAKYTRPSAEELSAVCGSDRACKTVPEGCSRAVCIIVGARRFELQNSKQLGSDYEIAG